MQLSTNFALAVAFLVAYLFGSINFAIIIGKIFTKKDVRDYGSGNAGMTNVLRSFGKLPALLTTIGDFFKGVLAIVVGRWVVLLLAGELPAYAEVLLLLPGLVGHCFPIFHGFRGGKGILVCAGMICVLDWRVLLIILSVFIITVAATRFVSLGSIFAATAYPISTVLMALLDKAPTETLLLNGVVSLLAGALVVFMHRANVVRLIKGTESKLSFSKAGKER